jgi:deoxyribose-phosphate aldolase
MTAPKPVREAEVARVMATIEHTLIRPEMTRADVAAGIELAQRLGTAVVVIRPWEVSWAAQQLQGLPPVLVTYVGFPHGTERTDVKVRQAESAVADGAREIDVVMNVGAFRSGDLAYVESELREIIGSVAPTPVKVILETAFLSREGVVAASRLAAGVGAAFVKNGTGFSPRGADVAEIAAMRDAVGPGVGVKAAGSIRHLDAVLELLAAGANRIGTSATAAIAEEIGQVLAGSR